MDELVDPATEVEYVGPFESHAVVVNGWQVPHLHAHPMTGGRVHLNLDHRVGLDLPLDVAELVVPFLADCIAVASGYTCHPRPGWQEPVKRSPFVRMMPLGVVEES